MKSKVVLSLAIIAILLSCFFTGCGVSQEEYDKVNAQLKASQTQVAELQNEIGRTDAKLRASQTQVAELQTEIRELKEQYEIVGETPAETAEKIVKWYHETHVYSKYDFFVCSDMALDVWNMLKAQGIDALIQIGNVETGAKDITETNHAWVLAETSPGHYLALEPTGGYVVSGEDNPLYYRGWSFDNPREYKRFVELRQEYNIRVSIIEQLEEAFGASRSAGLEARERLLKLANEVSEMSVLDPLLGSKIAGLIEKAEECGEYIGRCDQLNELASQQQQELENIVSEMRGLTN